MGNAMAMNFTVAAMEASTHYALEGEWLAPQLRHWFPWLRMGEPPPWVMPRVCCRRSAAARGLPRCACARTFPLPVGPSLAPPARPAPPTAHWAPPPGAPPVAVVSMRDPISQAISMVFHNLDSGRK